MVSKTNGGLPESMLADVGGGKQGLITANLQTSEVLAQSGNYYSAFITRTGVPATSDTSYLVTVSPDADLYIDNMFPALDFSAAGTGKLTYTVEFYLQESNANSYTYTGGSVPAPLGSNLNGYMINKKMRALVSTGGTAAVTGSPDFIVAYSNYFLEAQGVNQQITESGSAFFANGRRIQLKAGTTALIRARTTGTITGTVGVRNFVDLYEVSI